MNDIDSLEESCAVALVRKTIVLVTFLVTGIKHMTKSNISTKKGWLWLTVQGIEPTVVWKAQHWAGRQCCL